MIRDYLGDGARYGVRIAYSEESPRALETGGRHLPRAAAARARTVCWWSTAMSSPTFRSRRLALAADRDAHLVLVPNPPQHPQGDFGLEQGLALAERRRAVHLLRHRRVPSRLLRRLRGRRVSA